MEQKSNYISSDKGILYINGINFVYDYRFVSNDLKVYYINTDLCGNGGSAKNTMGDKIHKLCLTNEHSITDITDIVNEYSRLYCYKVVKVDKIYIMYICPYGYFGLIKDQQTTDRFTDLD